MVLLLLLLPLPPPRWCDVLVLGVSPGEAQAPSSRG